MKHLRFAALAVLCAASSAFAQTATLTSETTTLSPGGGQLALTATVNYDGEPGAVGWAIALPADWTLVSVGGPNVPAIAPDPGSTGTLEFAFTGVPAQRAQFTVIVRYPADAKTTTATSTVLVRTGGKLNTLTPKPVPLRGQPSSQPQSRD